MSPTLFGFFVGVLIGLMSVAIIWSMVRRRIAAFHSGQTPTVYDWAAEDRLSDADWDYLLIVTGLIGLFISGCLLLPMVYEWTGWLP